VPRKVISIEKSLEYIGSNVWMSPHPHVANALTSCLCWAAKERKVNGYIKIGRRCSTQFALMLSQIGPRESIRPILFLRNDRLVVERRNQKRDNS
jgi:hypothetical protein